jgi:hypothetical protein
MNDYAQNRILVLGAVAAASFWRSYFYSPWVISRSGATTICRRSRRGAEFTSGNTRKSCLRARRTGQRPHSSSASRRTASLSGFFILSQYGDRPET